MEIPQDTKNVFYKGVSKISETGPIGWNVFI
jgi:hypothetical protein